MGRIDAGMTAIAEGRMPVARDVLRLAQTTLAELNGQLATRVAAPPAPPPPITPGSDPVADPIGVAGDQDPARDPIEGEIAQLEAELARLEGVAQAVIVSPVLGHERKALRLRNIDQRRRSLAAALAQRRRADSTRRG